MKIWRNKFRLKCLNLESFFFNLSNRYFTTGDQFLYWCLPSLHFADRKSRHTVYSSNVPIRAYQANNLECWVSCWESNAHVCIHRCCCSGQSSRLFIKNCNFGIAGEYFNVMAGLFWKGKPLLKQEILAGKFLHNVIKICFEKKYVVFQLSSIVKLLFWKKLLLLNAFLEDAAL